MVCKYIVKTHQGFMLKLVQ